jgi:hypothetical protein
LTQREHYQRFSRGERIAPPNMDMGPSMPAYERWLSEGLNPGLDPRRYDEWCDAFGLDRYYNCVSVTLPSEPLFTEQIFEETEDTVTLRRSDGSIIQDGKGWHKSIPHELRPAVTNREEWERLKAWIDVDAPLPDPATPEIQAVFDVCRNSTQPVRLGLSSILGMPRNWLGFEPFLMLAYDDPQWLEDLVETQCRDAERTVRYFGDNGIPLDCLHFWEDICYKNGPMVNPVHFREYALPRYRRVADLAKSYGYDQVSVDSDGNIWALMPHWIEGGVGMLWPLEVQAGMDINEVQEKFLGKCCFMGGIHKHRLSEDEKAIAEELKRVKPAVERGGYIPGMDHNIPMDVSFENFLTYLKLRHEILGLGDGMPDVGRVRA